MIEFLFGVYVGGSALAGKLMWDHVKDDPTVVKGELFPTEAPAWFIVGLTMVGYPVIIACHIIASCFAAFR